MAHRLRSCVLLAAGALGLHQLRYALAFGGGAGHALRAQGHAYLGPVTAAVVAGLILALAVGLQRLAAGTAGAAATHRLARLWTAAGAALLAIYAAQESIEGALAPGHPAGLAALTAHGGWIAVPLAAALGLVIALALRGARAAVETVAAVARRLSPRRASARAAALLLAPAATPVRRRRPVLAAAAAGRAPPRAS
jgi:hypothetical protein